MSREIALTYSQNARPAGAQGGNPSHYAPGEIAGSRPVAGVTVFEDPPPISQGLCSATTRNGDACKAHPVRGSDLCVGHTRQKAVSK
jgi:hypothetical protein